jgi:hypothetical protein
MTKTMDSAIKAVFSSYPEELRAKLLVLRALILDTASEIEAVGELTETLKWGEPAYLTERSKSGSTIRIGWKKSAPTQYAMYFNCQTTLVDTFRTLFPELHFEGNRAVVFEEHEELPVECVSQCITLALTYHSAKKRNRQSTQRG